MNRLYFIILLFLANNIANANSIPLQIRSEFGSCYESFPNNLIACKPSSCTYPDLTDSKSWKAHTIIGMVNNKCYITYYSYIEKKIISDPDHCFYNKKQIDSLVSYYRRLFKTESSFEVIDLKEKINYLTYIDCKKNDQNQNKK